MRTFPAFLIALSLAACGGKKKEEAGNDGNGGAAGPAPTTGASAGKVEVPAIDVAAGVTSSCALMKGGTVRCWGRTDFGETGFSAAPGQAATPIEVVGISGAEALIAGGDPGDSGDAFCVLAGGKVTCWGHPQAIPLRIDDHGPRGIPGLSGVKQLALGTGYGLALLGDGTVQSWGTNVFKQRGTDGLSGYEDEAKLAAVPGISGATAVAAGQNHACALLVDGTASCWGYPSKKLDPTPVAGAADLTAIAAGGSETCAIKKDGAVVCWGESLQPRPLANVTGAAELAMRNHACVRTGEGNLWCWGANWFGQTGAMPDRASNKPPTMVDRIAGVTAVSTSTTSTCAVTGDGGVWCWGYNRYGQLGDGTLIDRHVPKPVASINAKKLPPTVSGDDKVQPTAAQSFDDVPADCKHGPLQVKWNKVEGDTFPVASAHASVLDPRSVSVTLSNHGVDAKKAGEPRRGPQLALVLRFAHLDADRKPIAVDPGTYGQDVKGDRVVYLTASDRVSERNMLSAMGMAGVAEPGTVTITRIDGDWLCGEIATTGKDAAITGAFAAKITK